ncbi:hypothetical protein [Sphingomonas sp. DBB INV C78]|uniref:hypothetical protein n=1 Tax=Sphingomonas sp. DBB INV C78 TaxID=3349434 RepID=UPI0036D2E8F4
MALIAMASPAEAEIFEYARSNVNGWGLKARTIVRTRSDIPYIDDIMCQIQKSGITIYVNRSDNMKLDIRGSDRAEDFAAPEIRGLKIGSRTYEAMGVETSGRRWTLDGVKYPDQGDIIPIWKGYLAFRKDPSRPWLNVNSLIPDLIEIDSLIVSYKSMSGNPRSVKLDISGMGNAIKQCQEEIESNEAFRRR